MWNHSGVSAKESNRNRGRGDPSGLEQLSTATSDPSGASEVSSSLSSVQGDKVRRVAEQLQAVRSLFEKQKTDDMIEPAQPKSVDLKIPTSPSVDATIRNERVSEVMRILQNMRCARDKDVGPTTSPTALHQQEGHQKEPQEVNPHVLPAYVSRLNF